MADNSSLDREEERSRLNSEGTDDLFMDDDPYPVPPPPDGGYGWVIVFASFMCNLIVDGIAYTFGVFLPEFVKYYGEGKGTVAWVGSLLSGMYLSAGPIVSALANKYGCRAVCIAGAIMASSAFVLSTFSTSVTMLMITYGVLGGIGFGMIYLPAVVAVGYYFETKRSLATGIAVCGSGVGTFAFAPLATYLLEVFDWKNANLVLAGLILNCAVFGAMMRPLEYPKKDKQKSLMLRMYEEKKAQLERGSIAGSFFMVQLPDGTMERRMKMPVNADPGVHSSLALDQMALQTVPTLPTITESGRNQLSPPGPLSPTRAESRRQLPRRPTRVSESDSVESNLAAKFPRNSSQPTFPTNAQSITKNVSTPMFERTRKISLGERYKPSLAAIRAASSKDMGDTETIYNSKLSVAISPEKPTTMVRPLSRKDIFYSGSVTNLKEYQSQKSLSGYRFSVLSFTQYEKEKYLEQPLPVPAEPEKDLCPCLALPDAFKQALGAMMDISLLKDPAFLCIGISNVFGMAGLYVPFVYLVDAAVLNGIEPKSASLLISIIGITNTVGRIGCGYIADFPQVNSLLLNNICLVLSTIAVAAVPLCSSYTSYIIVAILFGFAISGYISLTSIILVDLLGLDKLTNAFGLLILFRGAACIVGSPLAGILYDMTSSYSISFLVAGALFGMSAATSFLAPLASKCRKIDDVQMQLEALTPIDEEPYEDDDEDEPITLVAKMNTSNSRFESFNEKPMTELKPISERRSEESNHGGSKTSLERQEKPVESNGNAIKTIQENESVL
uniref:CSON009264 protein n=1 Tax=Culicoides sonorensis TaxID=179676 RepID=A0A336N0X6_CULSO